MNLTPATLRLDLKCGRGAISEGEKCHVGPASKAPIKQQRPLITAKNAERLAQGVVIGAGVGLTVTYLTALHNSRSAFQDKFGGANRFVQHTGQTGDFDEVIKNIQYDNNKVASPSAFGQVRFGTFNGRNVVVKTVEPTLGTALQDIQLRQKKEAGLISTETYENFQKLRNLTQAEVEIAQLAGKHGFGPSVLGAKNNTIIMDVAQGRPLISQDLLLRRYKNNPAVMQAAINEDPQAFIATAYRSAKSYKNISDLNKRRVLDGLAKMHTSGIAHNDLHLGNVFISHKGAQFIDFGLAEQGGGAVAAEFVRLMNPPQFGLASKTGHGYNLKQLDPDNYAQTEKALRQLVRKRVGPITAQDIRKAVEASGDNKKAVEDSMQAIIDGFYTRYASRSRTDAALTPYTLRLDLKCGRGAISKGEKCHKGQSSRASRVKTAAKVALGVGAAAGLTALYFKRRGLQPPTPLTSKPSNAPAQPQSPSPSDAERLARSQRSREAAARAGQGLADRLEKQREAVRPQPKPAATPTSKPSSPPAPSKQLIDRIERQVPNHKFNEKHNYVYGTSAEGKFIALSETPKKQLVGFYLDPGGEARFQANDAYTKDKGTNPEGQLILSRVERMFQQGIKDLPPTKRIFVSPEDGDSFDAKRAKLYKRYGFKPSPDDPYTFEATVEELLRRSRRTDAAGRPCGQGHIAAGKKCRQAGSFPTRKAIAAGLGVAAVAGGAAYALSRRNRVTPARVTVMAPRMVQPGSPQPQLPGDRTTRRLRGTTPKGLLPPSPPRLSKTARMRANTGAAVGIAERRIAQTAREEVRRVAQIGNTMAAAGEATGMAAKTGWREVRLRVEAARRRYEPGYRRSAPRLPRLLTGGAAAPVRLGLTPRSVSPQRVRRGDADDGKKGKPCGASHIPATYKCGKKQQGLKRKVATAAAVAVGAGLTAGAIYGLSRKSPSNAAAVGSTQPLIKQTSATAQLKKSTEIALPALPPAKFIVNPAEVSHDVQKRASDTQKWHSDFKLIASNKKHNFLLGEMGSAGDRVRIGWSATRNGDIVELQLEEYALGSWEVTFAVNNKTQRLAGRFTDAQAINALSRVERMLQAGIKDLDDRTVLLANAIGGDYIGEKREKLYKRFGFKLSDFGKYVEGEGPFFLHATVGDIKRRSRRNDALTPLTVNRDADDGKKYTKVVTNPKTGRKRRVRYGAKGYRIAPGTSKGNSYCARSFGDMKSHGKNCAGADRNTPLCLSRTKWRCSGKTSRRDGALTPGKSSAW